MKFGVKLALAALAVYTAVAVFGEVQYRVAQARDVTAAYNLEFNFNTFRTTDPVSLHILC